MKSEGMGSLVVPLGNAALTPTPLPEGPEGERGKRRALYY
jgi:hypothetical protein